MTQIAFCMLLVPHGVLLWVSQTPYAAEYLRRRGQRWFEGTVKRMRDCAGPGLLRLLDPRSAAGECTRPRSSRRCKSGCTRPRAGGMDAVPDSGRAPLVPVVKAASLRNGADASEFRRMHGPGIRGVFAQRQVRSRLMAVAGVQSENPTERSLVEDDHMIGALSAN